MSAKKEASVEKSASPVSAEKQKALDLALSSIEKQFGKGSVMRLGSNPVVDISFISSGIPSLDWALSGKVPGGIPQGRIIEIYGPESSGKTTLTLHFAAQVQKMGGTVAFIDAEHALDTAYAARMGVDVSSLIVSQPDNGEQALEIADTLVKSGAVDLLIVDSVAALTPAKELEGEMGDSHMGLQARLMSQGLRKLTGSISKSGATVIFINQLRMKIGVMFGNPETTTGGNALKFYASIRIDIRKEGLIKDGEDVIGQGAKVKIIKNKIFGPFKETHLKLFYGQAGFDTHADLLELAVKYGIVNKGGAWFSFGGNKWQGEKNMLDALRTTPALTEEVQKLVSAFFNPATAGELPAE